MRSFQTGAFGDSTHVVSFDEQEPLKIIAFERIARFTQRQFKKVCGNVHLRVFAVLYQRFAKDGTHQRFVDVVFEKRQTFQRVIKLFDVARPIGMTETR